LAKLLRSVVAQPERTDNWLAILDWGGLILAPPVRGGKRHNLATVIKNRVEHFPLRGSDSLKPPQSSRNQSKKQPSALLADAVAAKLEDGNVRAAIRLLNSEDIPVTPSEESLRLLQEKHPAASEDTGVLPRPVPDSALSVSEADVRQSVLSFPAGSSGGPDGLRPQHLKDLVLCRESGSDFLAALTLFVNSVLAGSCPQGFAPYFFGGRLLALGKKSGGIRPIAVGLTLRRLVCKCASSFGSKRMVSSFHPRQLGVGVAGGCEAAIHSARRFLQNMPSDYVVVKLDFSNAFNSLNRCKMLASIRESLPELYPLCYSAYSRASLLFFGSYTIESQEGPQQGDPLGPLLFCDTIQPLLDSLKSVLTLGYLDDVTLGGPQDEVASDVRRIIEVGQTLGLELNISKCEVITHPGTVISDPTICLFTAVSAADSILLGSPLFPGAMLDKTWSDRCADLSRAVERLSLVGSQDALILLRASFSAPRVQHLLRCSPSADHAALATFDDLLRSALSHITNSDLSEAQWLQASLPIKDGGLGVRRVASLALPAFLASAAGTVSLQDAILARFACPTDSFFDTFQQTWSSTFGTSPPADAVIHKQSFWDRPSVLRDLASVESGLVTCEQQASFRAATAPHSGDWLHALPIASCGLRLDDEAVRVAVGLRLGSNVCVPHSCGCGTLVDAHGSHAFICKRAPGRIARHQALNDVVARAFVSAGVPVAKEPVGLARQDGKRPDGLTLIPWQRGKPVTWDVTVAHTLADSYVSAAARSGGAAAEQAAGRKSAKYDLLVQSGRLFQPIAAETLGPLNESSLVFFSELGRKIASVSGDNREPSFLFQRVSVVVQRFNAILLHNSFSSDEE